MAVLSARQLNRATLARQLLLARRPMGAADAVHRVVALQAQEPASPFVALWNRISDFTAEDLDGAFRDGSVLKATLMRGTLHAVAAEDHPVFHHALASSLRASRLHDRRFAAAGLGIDELDALVPDVLAFLAQPRRNAEVDRWFEERLGRPAPRAWWALRTFGPVVHAAGDGPWCHDRRPRYVAAPTDPLPGDPAPSVQRLVWRYLEAFGPATPRDIAQFTVLRAPVVRQALDALAGTVETVEGPDGLALYDVAAAPRPDADTPAPPRLMAMWDSVLLAYADRDRILPALHRPHVIRRNGDVLPTLLVDGYVAGVWRPLDGRIEVRAFVPLSAATWADVASEATALTAFLADRDPDVYGRYAHWWRTIPAEQVRLLPG